MNKKDKLQKVAVSLKFIVNGAQNGIKKRMLEPTIDMLPQYIEKTENLVPQIKNILTMAKKRGISKDSLANKIFSKKFNKEIGFKKST